MQSLCLRRLAYNDRDTRRRGLYTVCGPRFAPFGHRHREYACRRRRHCFLSNNGINETHTNTLTYQITQNLHLITRNILVFYVFLNNLLQTVNTFNQFTLPENSCEYNFTHIIVLTKKCFNFLLHSYPSRICVSGIFALVLL